MINFKATLERWQQAAGCLEVAVTQLNTELLEYLNALPDPPAKAAEYLHKSWNLRRHPQSAFPFAKSIICAAFPFNDLPRMALPATDNKLFGGTVAGYATRLDYHIAGKEKMAQLQTALNCHESKICIDTQPLAEKIIAEWAGLGCRGRNHCVLCENAFSGCYLAFLLIDAELPEMRPAPFEFDCNACGKCETACPNGVFSDDRFALEKCVSFLTMEKKGALTPAEVAMLNNSVFGCSCCTASCPGGKMPEDIQLDLEWLLLAPASEIRKTIHNTALEYAGTTLLRRNAVYLLQTRNTPETSELLGRFNPGSSFLQSLLHSS